MKNLFLIIGAPGSGKTTDAQIVAEHNATFRHFSTGDLLREQIANKTEMGKIIQGYTDKGNLVPLNIVVEIIVNAINSCDKNNIIIDGYPRNVEQMIELDKVLKANESIKLKSVIEVYVSEKVAKERVLGRARGADDNEEVFNNRMKVYTEPLREIQDFYAKKSLLHKINAERTIEEIVSDIEKFIESKM